jgi:hypothetical protein
LTVDIQFYGLIAAHVRLTPRQPADEFGVRKRRIADLANVLADFAHGEDPRYGGTRAD